MNSIARKSSTYILGSIFLIVLILAYFILKPFFTAILESVILAYIFYPLYRFTHKRIKNDVAASLIVTVVVFLVFILPLLIIGNLIIAEAQTGYSAIKQFLLTTNTSSIFQCQDTGWVCKGIHLAQDSLHDPTVRNQLSAAAGKFIDIFVSGASNFILLIPSFFLNFSLMLFMLYYLFKEGDVLVAEIRRLIPLRDKYKDEVLKQLKDISYAVIYGHVLISAIQAAAMGLAFWFFGVHSPILWTFIMFFFALVPVLGTPVIWVPAVIIKFLMHSPGQAIGLLIAGLVIATVDNFIKPKIVSHVAPVHPVVVLLGTLGGLFVFGLVGVIVGPIVVSLLLTFIKIYEEENNREI